MAPERRTEPEKVRLRQVPQAEPVRYLDFAVRLRQASAGGTCPIPKPTVRLRQVPPVIADRVTDPMRFDLRGSDE